MELRRLADNSVIGSEGEVHLKAEGIHREHGAIHTKLSVSHKGSLVYDTINIDKLADRMRLAQCLNGAGKEVHQFCGLLEEAWTIQRYEVEEPDVKRKPPPAVMYLDPYIREGSGTVIFAPRESGKTYLLMTMGLCIATGDSTFWNCCTPHPVLYVNLERDKASMDRRLYYLAKALGKNTSRMKFIHCKGASLPDIMPRVTMWQLEFPNSVILIDSISRTGVGDLNENVVANKIIDMFNQFTTWVAIAHTPRDDDTHPFGSVHFEGAADVTIKVSSEDHGLTKEVTLAFDKASDIPKTPPESIRFEFDKDGLSSVSKLAVARKTNLARVIEYLMVVGEASATDIEEQLHITREKVSTMFNKNRMFMLVRKEGHSKFYGLSVPLSVPHTSVPPP